MVKKADNNVRPRSIEPSNPASRPDQVRGEQERSRSNRIETDSRYENGRPGLDSTKFRASEGRGAAGLFATSRTDHVAQEFARISRMDREAQAEYLAELVQTVFQDTIEE